VLKGEGRAKRAVVGGGWRAEPWSSSSSIAYFNDARGYSHEGV